MPSSGSTPVLTEAVRTSIDTSPVPAEVEHPSFPVEHGGDDPGGTSHPASSRG